MPRIKNIEIADKEFFTNWIKQVSGGATLTKISLDIGHGPWYLAQAIRRGYLNPAAVLALEHKFGVCHEDMLTIMKTTRNCKQNEEQTADAATIEEIKKNVERQTAMLSSIGKILTNLEEIMTKAWG